MTARNKMKRGRLAAAGIAIALMGLATSCLGGPERTVADKAVSEFHARYNGEDFKAIYAAADDRFRKASNETEYLAFMSAIHRKLGSYNSSTPGGSNLFKGFGRTQVTVALDSSFEEGHATEQFSWLIADDGTARLVGYNISSPQLVIK